MQGLDPSLCFNCCLCTISEKFQQNLEGKNGHWDIDFFFFFKEVSLSWGKIMSYFVFSWVAYLQDGLHPDSSKLFTSQKDNVSCQKDKGLCQEVLQNTIIWTFINSAEFLMATATNNLWETRIGIVYSRILPVALQFIQVHKLYFSQKVNLCFCYFGFLVNR